MKLWPKIPVYVLSVRGFDERQENINAQAAKFGFEPIYIFDFDVGGIREEDLKKFDANAKLPKASISLVLKHLRAMERIVESEAEFALVLEDDAEFFEGAVDRFHKVIEQARALRGPWLIFLGGADNKVDERFLADSSALILSPITTAEAILLDRAGCIARLSYLNNTKVNLPADHLLKTVDQLLKIPHYRVSDPLFSQGSITGKFETKLDGSRRKHSRGYIRVKYWYNRIRRQLVPRLVKRVIGRK